MTFPPPERKYIWRESTIATEREKYAKGNRI
jgi:hypothetical protein